MSKRTLAIEERKPAKAAADEKPPKDIRWVDEPEDVKEAYWFSLAVQGAIETLRDPATTPPKRASVLACVRRASVAWRGGSDRTVEDDRMELLIRELEMITRDADKVVSPLESRRRRAPVLGRCLRTGLQCSCPEAMTGITVSDEVFAELAVSWPGTDAKAKWEAFAELAKAIGAARAGTSIPSLSQRASRILGKLRGS